jgi:hypothetical protein
VRLKETGEPVQLLVFGIIVTIALPVTGMNEGIELTLV